MSYQRYYDEESSRAGELACINDAKEMKGYAVPLATTIADVSGIKPGIYRMFLAGMDGTKTVAVLMTDVALGTNFTFPTNGQASKPFSLFPGNVVERLRVTATDPVINAQISSGTGTLYLVPVVAG